MRRGRGRGEEGGRSWDECRQSHLSLLPSTVVSAKPKAQGRQSRITSFVEIVVDGLANEAKKTGKQTGSSELVWNESLVL